MYFIKEIYYTIQGEGFYTGRPAIFIRFSGCNLWTGLEKDSEDAICYWCETNFICTDVLNGGKYSAEEVKKIIKTLWPEDLAENPYVVCTGGEPLLQMDDKFIRMVHETGFEIGIETNGTILPPADIDWICVSPKANTDLLLIKGDELKIVFPQDGIKPKVHEGHDFDHFFLQPMDGPDLKSNTQKAKEFIALHPQWKLSIQSHKILCIP